MMSDRQVDPEPGASKLPDLLHRSLFDSDLKRLLIEQPQKAIERYNLNEDDQRRLAQMSWADLEYAFGKLVRFKLMPVQIGQRVWISPQPSNGNGGSERLEIYLDQSATGAKIGPDGLSNRKGVVFGSGTHPTTRMCVLLLERCVQPGMRVLDLGTGSGILSIAASRLGAEEIVGLDIDSDAIEMAQTNVSENELNDRISLYTGGIEWLRAMNETGFDLIVANILASVHHESIEAGLLDHLNPSGRVILSGMHQPGAKQIAHKLYRAGASRVYYMRMGSWYALMTTLPKGG